MHMISENDPKIWELYKKEMARQEGGIQLIASENYASPDVMAASGGILTNKYSEGYPGKRYYGGNEFVDSIETIAIERAKKLFGAEHANVQPHSGSSANMAAYYALLERGDKLMGLSLDEGGHLTHGLPVNFSGKYYEIIPYHLNAQTHLLDYDSIAEIADEQQPKMIIAGYTMYSRTIDFAKFRKIADSVGAKLLVDMSHIAGLIAGGAHPNPAPYADVITSTTHKTLRGPRGAIILSQEQYAKQIDRAIFPGLQGGPFENQIMARAVAFNEALQPSFSDYAAQIVKNAKALASALTDLGLVLVTGGTDNHLMLLDVRNRGLTGKEAQLALDGAGITCNKNTVPNDPQSPFITSGIRLGTPALTTRGMKEGEMQKIAHLIDDVLKNSTSAEAKSKVKKEALALTAQFPIYKNLRD
ncbi:serine hydroxymethyltransferase [Candidatus Micrarchaeota archaeon CG10_big_fil_rev_8_21_14_0_10_45_29]|nr:MAG: serine hydroxymethyltransferase [Candidatus Micrarchaeota archaeon CG10_big_fil_rev_8_21_14_0_10_45_29]